MRHVTPDEILPPERYAELRPARRASIMAHKRDRRVAVGDRVMLLFEDHETLLFQIQEMVWIERIADPDKVQAEIDVYNDLMPGERELSATLFIEITEQDRIRPELDRLIGIDEHVSLWLGAGTSAETIPARFDPKQYEEDRISAVQFVRIPFDEAQARRFADPAVPAGIRIDHPSYRAETPLPENVRASLCRTLAGAPPPRS